MINSIFKTSLKNHQIIFFLVEKSSRCSWRALLILCRIVSQNGTDMNLWKWFTPFLTHHHQQPVPVSQLAAATNDTKEVRKDPSFVIVDRISVDFRTFCPLGSISTYTYIDPQRAESTSPCALWSLFLIKEPDGWQTPIKIGHVLLKCQS